MFPGLQKIWTKQFLGLDVWGPKKPAASRNFIPLMSYPDKKGSLVMESVRMCNEVLVWMSTTATGGMFGGPYIYGQRGSVGMVVLAKYGKSAQTSAL